MRRNAQGVNEATAAFRDLESGHQWALPQS
jgi:hypothetical protein